MPQQSPLAGASDRASRVAGKKKKGSREKKKGGKKTGGPKKLKTSALWVRTLPRQPIVVAIVIALVAKGAVIMPMVLYTRAIVSLFEVLLPSNLNDRPAFVQPLSWWTIKHILVGYHAVQSRALLLEYGGWSACIRLVDDGSETEVA